MNQAIFEAIWISHSEVVRAELASPLKETHDLVKAIARRHGATKNGATDAKASDPKGSEVLDGGWIRTKMVERAWRRANHVVVAPLRIVN